MTLDQQSAPSLEESAPAGSTSVTTPEGGALLSGAITVPTNTIAETRQQYAALGYRCWCVYHGFAYPTKCEGKLWALGFWKNPPKQMDLICVKQSD